MNFDFDIEVPREHKDTNEEISGGNAPESGPSHSNNDPANPPLAGCVEAEEGAGAEEGADSAAVGGETYQNLLVTKLPRHAKDEDLEMLFLPLGARSATVMLDAKTGRSKGFGFVLFPTEKAGRRAHAALHQKTISIAGSPAALCIYPSKHDARTAVDPSPSLYVRNVPAHVPKAAVERMLEQYGSVAFCAMREEPDGLPVWVILVEYDCQRCADNALKNLRYNTVLYPGSQLPVIAKYAKAMDRKRHVPKPNAVPCPFKAPAMPNPGPPTASTMSMMPNFIPMPMLTSPSPPALPFFTVPQFINGTVSRHPSTTSISSGADTLSVFADSRSESLTHSFSSALGAGSPGPGPVPSAGATPTYVVFVEGRSNSSFPSTACTAGSCTMPSPLCSSGTYSYTIGPTPVRVPSLFCPAVQPFQYAPPPPPPATVLFHAQPVAPQPMMFHTQHAQPVAPQPMMFHTQHGLPVAPQPMMFKALPFI